MSDQIKELLQFLHDKNPQVRQIALSNLLSHTANGSPHRDIYYAGLQVGGLRKTTENTCIRDLKLLCRDQLAISHDAFRALVNLSDNAILADALAEVSFLTFIVSYILHPSSILADLASMLLSNATAHAPMCAAILSLKIPIMIQSSPPYAYYPPQSRCATSPPPSQDISGETREVPALPLLVHAFVQAAAKGQDGSEEQTYKGNLHFLANVFANISASVSGRLFFLTARPVNVCETELRGVLEYPLAQLVIFTEHEDIIRRGGITSTIKNCAFHVPGHIAMLSSEVERVAVPPSTIVAPGIGVVPNVLLPLAGPEEYDLEDIERLPPALQLLPDSKKREPDAVLRQTHIETLLLLCSTREGRHRLRGQGVYEVVQMMHLTEKVEKIAELIERLVNLLKRDEESILEDGDDPTESSNSTAVAAPEKFASAVPTASDDEDEKIEEV